MRSELISCLFLGAFVLIILAGCSSDFGPVKMTTVDGKEHYGRITRWDEEASVIYLETGFGVDFDEKTIEYKFAFEHVRLVERVSEEDYLREMRLLMQVEEAETGEAE